MKSVLLVLAFAALLPLSGADQDSIFFWNNAQLGTMEKAIKVDNTGAGLTELVQGKNFNSLVARREGVGQAEVHEHVADFIMVRNGEGTVYLGGKATNPKTTAPGEIRGDKVEGGTRHVLSAGDMFYIPVNTPHQFVIEKGKVLNILVVKVEPQK